MKTKFKLIDNEEILFEGNANRMRFAVIGQGGKLFLTNKRVVFVGHGMNIGEGTISINVKDILRVRKARNLLIVPNAIKITSEAGKSFKFTLGKRKKWVNNIEKAMSGEV